MSLLLFIQKIQQHKNRTTSKSLYSQLYNTLYSQLYNRIPENVQNLSVKKFKNLVKKSLCEKGYYTVKEFFDDETDWQ